MIVNLSKRIERLRRKAVLGGIYLKAIALNKKTPLVIGWCITNKCNLKCVYCRSWECVTKELSTEEITQIILLLFRKGTRIIRFTGGEPLLRDDLPEVISFAQKMGMWTTVATNGTLIPLKARGMQDVDNVVVSIDGPENIHDALRGKGSYQKAVLACKVLFEKNIPISISTVLTSLNLNSIEYLLELAASFKAKVFFQPATYLVLFGNSLNPVFPDTVEYNKTISRILKLKEKSKAIGNSCEGLNYLLSYTHKAINNCVAGRLFFRIESSGDIHACPRLEDESHIFNIPDKGLDYCLNNLGHPICNNCQSSALIEMNILENLDLRTILNGAKM